MKRIVGALAALVVAGLGGSANAADVFTVTNVFGGNGYATPIAGGADLYGPDGLPLGIAATFDLATASTAEVLTYFWNYASYNAPPIGLLDPAGYYVNGALSVLSGIGASASGQVTFHLNAGDTYGFYVGSWTSQGGPGALAFSTVGPPSAPRLPSPAPEPGEWALMLGGLAMVAATFWARRAKPSRSIA